jgi:transcriptional regulator with XRE-family HTH domain
MYFAKNLRYLREKNGKPSQEKLGDRLGLSRSVVSSYEDGRAEPKLEILDRIAKYFGVTIDQIVNEDISKLDESSITERKNVDKYIRGENLRIIAITTDKDDNENIELVPHRVSAGYTKGYADPEYLSELPKYQLPFLAKGKSYRAFEINGDSMLPIKSGSIVIGEYIENWDGIRDGQECVVVSRFINEGVVFKKVYNRVENEGVFVLRSSNINHPTYTIPAGDIQEIWKFSAYISKEFPDDTFLVGGDIKNAFWRLEEEVRKIKKDDSELN